MRFPVPNEAWGRQPGHVLVRVVLAHSKAIWSHNSERSLPQSPKPFNSADFEGSEPAWWASGLIGLLGMRGTFKAANRGLYRAEGAF